MNKSNNFNFKFTKEQVEAIIRQHIIDTHENEDADFKNADAFDSEDYYWDSGDEKEFLRVDIFIDNVPLRKPKAK